MRLLLCTLALAVAAGCGHVTRARPTPEGQIEVEAAAGGPMAAGIVPIPIPVPTSTVGARYGIHARGDIAAHVHLLPIAFDVAGFDVDSAWTLLEQDGAVPHVTANGRLYGFFGHGRGAAYFELTPSASWLFRDRFLTYVAATGLVQFGGGPPLFSLAAGEEIRFGRFSLQGEFRWYQPDYPTDYTVVNWLSLGGQGAWGLSFGASYRFGGEG